VNVVTEGWGGESPGEQGAVYCSFGGVDRVHPSSLLYFLPLSVANGPRRPEACEVKKPRDEYVHRVNRRLEGRQAWSTCTPRQSLSLGAPPSTRMNPQIQQSGSGRPS